MDNQVMMSKALAIDNAVHNTRATMVNDWEACSSEDKERVADGLARSILHIFSHNVGIAHIYRMLAAVGRRVILHKCYTRASNGTEPSPR